MVAMFLIPHALSSVAKIHVHANLPPCHGGRGIIAPPPAAARAAAAGRGLNTRPRHRIVAPMSKLTILEFPDPRLRTRAQPVEDVAALSGLIDDMFETMYAAPGIGLAATQVNVHQRFMVIDVSE